MSFLSKGPADSCCTLLLCELCKVKAPCYSDASVPGTGLTLKGSKHLLAKNQRGAFGLFLFSRNSIRTVKAGMDVSG